MAGFRKNSILRNYDVNISQIVKGTMLVGTGGGVFGSTSELTAIGATEDLTLILRNNTLSTVGSQNQWSPGILFEGHAWDTDNTVDTKLESLVQLRTEAATLPQSYLSFKFRIAGGGWYTAFDIKSNGLMYAYNTMTAGKLRCSDPSGTGVASNLTIGSGVLAAGSSAPTWANVPTGYQTTNIWLEMTSGTTKIAVPAVPIA